MTSPTLSVVVPMFRTARTLPQLHRRLCDSIPATSSFELIFVDDACDQGSAHAVRMIAARDPHVRLVQHERNLGQHHAIRTGLAASHGDAVVVLDGDLQDPPEAIPTLLTTLQTLDVAAVFAGRVGEYQGRIRMLSGSWFKRLMHRFGGVPSDAGGYVALRRELVDELNAQRLSSPYLLVGIAATRRPVASVPVRRDHRPEGMSATSTRTRLALALGSARVLWSERRRRSPS